MTPRKVTVSMYVAFNDLAMESTSAAIDIIKGVIITTSDDCKREIQQALEDAGAKDIKISFNAY